MSLIHPHGKPNLAKLAYFVAQHAAGNRANIYILKNLESKYRPGERNEN